MNLPLPS